MLFRRRPVPEAIGAAAAAVPSEVVAHAGGGRTVIGRHTRVSGRLSGDGPVLVRGSLEGAITIRGGLSVSGGGQVAAEVEAHSVDLAGEARGRMHATTRVTVSTTGAFEGDMDTPILDVSPGSIVRGHARVAGHAPKGRLLSH